MYENGRKVSRYHKMREHKRRMKERFLKNPYSTNIGCSYADYLAHLDEFSKTYHWGANMTPNAYQYWSHCWLSGPKQYAKKSTARAIRNYWRNEINSFNGEDWDDFDAGMNNNDYQKLFDYAWTVY